MYGCTSLCVSLYVCACVSSLAGKKPSKRGEGYRCEIVLNTAQSFTRVVREG